MPKWKKISLAIAVISVSAFAFLTWYKFHYSMDVAKSFEITAQDPEHHLLIATQGSNFKNTVVSGVIEALNDRPITIKVIDVSGLCSVNLDEWAAVVILHTWENLKPKVDTKLFLERQRQPDLSKVVILTTSGAGDHKMVGIDAITSASKMSEVPTHVAETLLRIDLVISEQRR